MTHQTSPQADLQEALVLEPDKDRGPTIASAISKVFPKARVYCESDSAVAAEILADRDIELFVVALRGFDLDVLTLLRVWSELGAAHTRVLVMTPDLQAPAIEALHSLPITGIFDSSAGDLRALEFACRAVVSGAASRRMINRPVFPFANACPNAVADVRLRRAGVPPKSHRPRRHRF